MFGDLGGFHQSVDFAVFMLGEWFAFKFFVQHISNSLYLRKKTTLELQAEGIYEDAELEGGDIDFERSQQNDERQDDGSTPKKTKFNETLALPEDKKRKKRKKRESRSKKSGSSSETEVIGEPLSKPAT